MAPSVLSTAVPAASKAPPASDDKPQNEGGGSGSKNQQPLKCPRCDSTNTKFCYYNNYSTAQPRHFCRACRRYWTHGGTLRDVPVGGASRRNGAKRRKIAAEPPEESPPPSGRADVPSLPTFPFVADVFCMPQLELEHGVAPAAWVLSPAAPDFYDGLAPWDDGARGVGVTGAWDNISDFVSLELGWPPAPDN